VTDAVHKDASISEDLPLITAQEFAARMARGLRDHQQSITWFLGAGCSISSGISAAGGLVERWLSELFAIRNGSKGELSDWARANFPEYDSANPAMQYADVFEARHPFPADRQREIEMICAAGEPAYGYATLAQLLSHPQYGRFCNTVLTTNFDDLIADALYLYGERHARPLVVTHEALARYVRTNSPRPIVVKLHGDAHIDPKNLKPEVSSINSEVRQQLLPFLQDHSLVFVGYGGNDLSILDFMRQAPVRSVASPIYWVSGQRPPRDFRNWLSERRAIRVNLSNFDQIMHLIRGALDLRLLSKDRWNRIGESYYRDFLRLTQEIEGIREVTGDVEALKDATKAAFESLPNDWAYFARAESMEASDYDATENIYRQGLEAFPKSSLLNGMYALFLDNIRQDADQAERYYRSSIELDPKDSTHLTNFAVFMSDVRGRPDEAEALHKRAVANDPYDAECLGNYAIFLEGVKKDYEMANTYYVRAIEADPTDTTYLTNYAIFLSDVRDDTKSAETYYLRAIDADPKDPVLLVNYAVFLDVSLGQTNDAERFFVRAIAIDEGNPICLANYGRFLNESRNDPNKAAIFFKRAVAADPEDATLREDYAAVLRQLGRNQTKRKAGER
jgi:Flp pilus assembly protein TadD